MVESYKTCFSDSLEDWDLQFLGVKGRLWTLSHGDVYTHCVDIQEVHCNYKPIIKKLQKYINVQTKVNALELWFIYDIILIVSQRVKGHTTSQC